MAEVRVPVVQRRDVEERVENGMRWIQPNDACLRQHLQHLRLEVVPVLSEEIVEDDEAALLQICAHPGCLSIGQRPEPWLRDVGNGEAMQLWIVEGEDVSAVHERLERAQLLHDLHQVPLGVGEVVIPLEIATPSTLAPEGLEFDPRESESAVVRGVTAERGLISVASPAHLLCSKRGDA